MKNLNIEKEVTHFGNYVSLTMRLNLRNPQWS